MNFMIVCILILGVAKLSIQSPIVDNNADQLELVIPDSEANSDDDLQVAENNIFRPFFRYKERRAFRRRVREVTPEDFADELPQLANQDSDDLEIAENNIFRPFFRYKERRAFRQRIPREATLESFNEDLPEIANEDVDDMEVAENHIFRPFFRYKERRAFRRRAPREATPEDFNKDLPQIPEEGDLNVAENRFYKPLYRIQKIYLRRAARDLQNQDAPIDEPTKSRSIRSVDSDLSNDGDDLQVAENHIFLPVFRYKQRAAYRRRVKKPVKTSRG